MKKRLRVIQVINVRWFNATAWYGLNLAGLLQEAGHEVRVLGLSGTESFARAEAMGLNVTPLQLNTLNPLRLPAVMRKMTTLLKAFQPHVVNCHRGEGTVLWGLCKAMGHPFALVRTRGDQRPPKASVPNRHLHTRLVDALVATNSRTAEQCRARLGLGADRLFTIVGGVDTRRFKPDPEGRAAVRQRYGFNDTDRVIGLLGRFDFVKGQKELLDAVARMPRDGGPRPKIMLMGFPTAISRETVEEWVHETGLAGRVVLTGKVEDVTAHISAMDLGVIASQGSEATARAAFEIMACGVPLVGTDVGVMPDLLPPEALAPVGDGEALTELLRKGVRDASFLASLRESQHGRMPRFSDAAFLERTLDVYYSVRKNMFDGAD